MKRIFYGIFFFWFFYKNAHDLCEAMLNSFLVSKINIYRPRRGKSVKSRMPCKHKIQCKYIGWWNGVRWKSRYYGINRRLFLFVCSRAVYSTRRFAIYLFLLLANHRISWQLKLYNINWQQAKRNRNNKSLELKDSSWSCQARLFN